MGRNKVKKNSFVTNEFFNWENKPVFHRVSIFVAIFSVITPSQLYNN